MLFLIGAQSCIRSIVELARPYLGGEGAYALKRAYQRALRGLQPNLPILPMRGIDLVWGGDRLQELGALFGLGRGTLAPQRWQIELIRAGHARLHEIDVGLGQVADLALNTVFAGGAFPPGCVALREALGVAYVNPGLNWNEDDVAEALLHGVTHTLLGIDRMTHGHVQPTEGVTLAMTAISGTRRPLVQAAHSVIVAAELLELRRRTRGRAGRHAHPADGDLWFQARRALVEVWARRHLLTARSVELLGAAEIVLASRSPERLTTSTNGGRPWPASPRITITSSAR